MVFTKRDPHAAPGFYAAKAAGLRWLGEADGGVPVATVIEVTTTSITLPRYPTTTPNALQAKEFGHRLARTHQAGAAHYGAAPPGVGHGFIATLPLPHLTQSPEHWGEFYARCRLEPFATRAAENGSLESQALTSVLKLCDRLTKGEPGLVGPDVPAARLHGDLWSGNVLWTPDSPLLIDPAAHGGHPETDLAMLALFGFPYLETVLDAYDEAGPLPRGWQDRVPLHQLHPLLVHAVLFGGSYGRQAARIASHYE